LQAGALTADTVALEARKVADNDDRPHPAEIRPPAPAPPPVTSLTARRLQHLPSDDRPMPSVAIYDDLLRLRSTDESRTP
jgi:hypothetical protein